MSRGEDLRRIYDAENDFLRRPQGFANASTIGAFCRSHATHQLGIAVTASLLWMGNSLSLVAVGEDGKIRSRILDAYAVPWGSNLVPRLDDYIEQFLSTRLMWFRGGEGITWWSGLEAIAHTVVDLVSECDAGARVLFLAVDPVLAGLPWQALIGHSARSRTRDAYLVSVVPNLGIACMNGRNSEFQSGIGLNISSETDQAITDIARKIKQTVPLCPVKNVSVRVVAGHGFARDAGHPTGLRLGMAGEISGIDDWITLLDRRHMILHVCHSGQAAPIFMGEMGGVPGIALSLGAEAIVAPITEVASSAACVLQECLFDGSSDCLGAAYLRAVARDPSISLYTLYGDPYASLSGS